MIQAIPAPSRPHSAPTNHPSVAGRWFRSGIGLLSVLAASALAPDNVVAQQAESVGQAGHRIAVIDVAYIFKNLPAIKAQIDKVEADLKKHDAELQRKREALKQSVAELKTLKAGTSDYARQEEKVADLESKLRLDAGRTQQRLSQAETKIYFDNYQLISAAVKTIATHNNITLVLRFNSEEMTLERGDTVARAVMKNVVYHDSAINMTETVMQYLEQQAVASQAASGDRKPSTNRR